MSAVAEVKIDQEKLSEEEITRNIINKWQQYNKDSQRKINTTFARHKIGKRKTIYSLRQYHTNQQNFGQLVILSRNNIKCLKEDFEKILEEANHKQEKKKKKESATSSTSSTAGMQAPPETTIEKDEIRSGKEQLKYKDDMILMFLEQMNNKVFDVKKEMCEGCLEDYPSQRDHYCLMTEAKEFLEDAFSNLIKVVDEEEANRRCRLKNHLDDKIYMSKKELLNDEHWVNELKKKILQSKILK